MGAIDLRRDAADHTVAVPGKEEQYLGVPEQRILLGREGLAALHVEMGHIALVSGIEPLGQRDEGFEVGFGGDGRDEKT